MSNNNVINEYYEIIKTKIKQSRFDSALESINKLLYNFPKNELGYYYKGVCELAKGQYEIAIRSYETAISLNPIASKAYFNIGICYYQIDKYDNALINIGKALIIFSKQKDLDSKQRCLDALKIIQTERKK